MPSSLHLREFKKSDAAFILKLVNQEGWLKYIGDRNIRTIEDAEKYIQVIRGKMRTDFGFGYFVFCTENEEPLGTVGLLNRHYLSAPDLGYAILKSHEGKGYTKHACQLLLDFFIQHQSPLQIQAIVQPNNFGSIGLLKSLNFQDKGMHKINDENLCLFELF